jgi:hypothetical protein
MTDTTHTPGPWSICKNFNGRGALDLFGEGGQIIIGNALIINQEANARLIAAAPDLLQALHDADEFCQQGLNSAEPPHWEAALQDIMDLVRNAIAKAKGA